MKYDINSVDDIRKDEINDGDIIVFGKNIDFMTPVVEMFLDKKVEIKKPLFNKDVCRIKIEKGLQFFINEKLIDVTGNEIISPENLKSTDFVLDIFKLCDNIKYYYYEEKDICYFHKDSDSEMYGPESKTFKRINNSIVEILFGSCCCNYSGGTGYFNLKTMKNIQECNCFLDPDKIEKMLNGECNCLDGYSDDEVYS